jgi:hypothetical protein
MGKRISERSVPKRQNMEEFKAEAVGQHAASPAWRTGGDGGELESSPAAGGSAMEKDGVIYSLDSRRLLAASQAGVPIKIPRWLYEWLFRAPAEPVPLECTQFSRPF